MSIIFPIFLSAAAVAVSCQIDASWNTRTTEMPRHFVQTQLTDQQKVKMCTDRWEAKVTADKTSRQTDTNKAPLTREDFRKFMADCLSNSPTIFPR
jgi:hypothetical protein